MNLEQELNRRILTIKPVDQHARELAQQRWDSIAKPLRSLGLLEQVIIDIAGIQRTHKVEIDKKCVAIMCADNGVVAQGVTQTGQEITALVTRNFCEKKTSVCAMAECAHADIIPVDIGVTEDVSGQGLRIHKISHGTKDMSEGPAMTREQAVDAILYGMDLVKELKEQGYRLIATGEMGIGNTTTTSAILSVLLERPVQEMTGRGAGLSSAGLQKKIAAIEKAITINKPCKNDPLDVLHKIGGLDIAGLVGVFLGGAVEGVPIVIDGIISAASALVAMKLCPSSMDYCIASHVSKEPAGKQVLAAIGKRPFLTADMCLGEGTGAVASFPIMDMANTVYQKMSTFSQIDMDNYELLD